MNKRKVEKVTVEYRDGGKETFECAGTMSISPNCRTAGKGSPRIIHSWKEFHITWVEYDEDEVEVPTDDDALHMALDGAKLKEENELFAGIQDGKVFYKKLPKNWEELFKDLTDGL